MKYRVGDLNVGDKFIKDSEMYLIIDFKLSSMSLTTIYPNVVCALNLNTYQIVGINPECVVEFEGDNVYI